jgi:hypothetical protein
MRRLTTVFLGLLMLTVGFAHADTVDFEDLSLAAESYYNGDDDEGGFDSGQARFNNLYDDSFYAYWEGFAYSNTTDTTTEDYTNQFSAYPGSGADNSTVYGVGYQPGPYGYGTVPTITFPEEIRIIQAAITNTTYAYYTMAKGYFTAKKFGGDTGDDKDWFLLTFTGKDSDGNVTGTVAFYLADFRFDNNAFDYILDEWTTVDLSGLGRVKSIEFALTSSDTDPDPAIGMNTPSYFAIDNIELSFSDGGGTVSLGCFIDVTDGWFAF